MFRVGDAVKVTGKVSESKNGGLSLTNPEIEKVSGLPIERHDTLFVDDTDIKTAVRFPIYPETRGLTSKWLYHAIGKILKSGALESIEEYIPEEILERYHLPHLSGSTHLARKTTLSLRASVSHLKKFFSSNSKSNKTRKSFKNSALTRST